MSACPDQLVEAGRHLVRQPGRRGTWSPPPAGRPSWTRVPATDTRPPGGARAGHHGVGHRPDRQLGLLPRRPGGHAGRGQGVVLPELAGPRGRRPVAGGPQPDGGGADQSRRDPRPTAAPGPTGWGAAHRWRPWSPSPSWSPSPGGRGGREVRVGCRGRLRTLSGGPVSRPCGCSRCPPCCSPTPRSPLHVFEERYRRLMADCLAGDGAFGVVLIARGSEVGGGDQRVDVGTVARIDRGRRARRRPDAGDGPRGRPDRRSSGGSARARIPVHGCRDLPLESRRRRRAGGRRRRAGRPQAAVAPVRAGRGPRPPSRSRSRRSATRRPDGASATWRLSLSSTGNGCSPARVSIEQMELLCELSTAMADDVVSLLAGGGADCRRCCRGRRIARRPSQGLGPAG